jgi:hypothetical protein
MIRALALTAFLIPTAALAQMTHEQMMQEHHGGGSVPTQPGQGAFAAIQEIVGILEADPKTEWSKVDIDALRQHLIDMNNVTLAAEVKSEPVEGGIRFMVRSEGAVRDSIRRMVAAHAATMNGVDGWRFEASEIDAGASLTARPPAKDDAKLHGLGFLGVMTRGMHHQEHHLMIARGEHPHE